MMRRLFALQCCLAFGTAFVLAPFQHVHAHGLIHSHLSVHHHDHPHLDKPGEREIESSDEDHATSLDTFTLVLSPDVSPFILSRAPAVIQPPAETRASYELVEERGHGPHPSRNFFPRAPPA
jgi:hypothetical protein